MNKVALIGRLTADPETRYTQTNNTMVVTFTLAVNRRFAKEGEKQADFIYITVWSKTAEFCSKYFHKRSASRNNRKIRTTRMGKCRRQKTK